MKRKILIFWAILYKAGYKADEEKLKQLIGKLDTKYKKELRKKIHKVDNEEDLPEINSLQGLLEELNKLVEFYREKKGDDVFKSSSSQKHLLDDDDVTLLEFLFPRSGSGTKLLHPYRNYHSKSAGDFATEIIEYLHDCKTVIVDLSNAHPLLMEYYSQFLSEEIFKDQIDRFSNNKLKNHYVQLYFEEAHNLFPNKETTEVDIYRRLAKEGAKYHIGMIYSTQSPSSIHPDLLAQTENFFVAHISSPKEVEVLGRMNIQFHSSKDDLLKLKRKGFVRMLTQSHRYVIPVQIDKFERR